MKFRHDIQGLRGVAVLLVVLYHYNSKITTGGYIGVDIFFVISGFLVCFSIENRIKDEKHKFFLVFYANRLKRLLPASLITLIVICVYVYKFDYTYFSMFKNDAISCLFVYANYKFYYSKIDYFYTGLKESMVLHYWSLSLEEQFYIISPILIWILYDHNILILYYSILLTSFIISIYYGAIDKNKGYFFLSSRSWEFISGSIIRSSYGYKNDAIYSDVTILLIYFLSFYYNDKIIYPSYNALIPVIFSCNLLLFQNSESIINNRILRKIGNSSYSIYLLHFPLKKIIKNSLLYYIIILTFIVYILYSYIEIPFNRCKFSSSLTVYLLSFISVLSVYKLFISLDRKIKTKLIFLKHYSSSELIREFIIYQRSYCCLNYSLSMFKSSVLFIGDSHIEQYISSLITSKYKYTYQLIHIYLYTKSYKSKSTLDYFQYIKKKYRFKLCIIGNYIERNTDYLQLYKLASNILLMCKRILISNDNPTHTVDPNSCFKDKKENCYGEINKTCYINTFQLKNTTKIKVVTFWEKKIIENNKCKYYYNSFPIYADYNHLSLHYLRFIASRVYKILYNNINTYDKYNYNNNCPYYQLSKTHFLYKNLKNEKCD